MEIIIMIIGMMIVSHINSKSNRPFQFQETLIGGFYKLVIYGLLILAVVGIVINFFPFILIGLIVYFFYKNRK